MENMSIRRHEKFGHDRRVDDRGIVRARNELARHKAAAADGAHDKAP
jgi:hypothetical protein